MSTPRKPTEKDHEYYDLALRHMLGALTGDIKTLEHETLGEGTGHGQGDVIEEGGGDGYFQELSLELLQRDESTVREIMDALDRLKEGTYGKCPGCQNWIQRPRLRAMPHAAYCIECQRARENGNFE
ncbi:MAG: DnaK suppressor protein [Planctomycetota bacterium]|jgi:DnaK suppressor protein